ncbi:hypothetical protein NLU13_0990 [Sarocladium strictum]|uniref:Uncharacterized protein n=1 Tax=Sarocladium strictum TaxID=5046 RepID=A0AA39LC14_SARSR|nr:hypothetical protein NLU13_0990 [Sarocladium strictum]
MLGVKQDKDILGAYCFFWALSMFFTFISVATKSPGELHFFKLFSAVAYGLYGGIALDMFNIVRVSGVLAFPGLMQFFVGQAFHGIFGIFLFFWSIVWCCCGTRADKRAPNGKLTAETGYRSRFFFYVVLTELIFTGALVVATALSYGHVPVGYAGCRKKRLVGTDVAFISDLTYEPAKEVCVRVVTTQILGIMSAILAVFQACMFIPFIAYPRIVRYLLYILFHRAPLTPRDQVLREKQSEAYRLEDMTPQTRLSEIPQLHEILMDDAMAEKIARHLHFVDITNLSRTSRSVRQSVYGGKKHPSAKRLQLFCEASCVRGQKSECWACARMTCKSCQQLRCNIPEPRTQTHATSCFAVCTKCYLLRAPALPAPRAAVENADDLSVQHTDCWRRCGLRAIMAGDVALCKSCNLLPRNEDVSEVRERRDADALRKARGGRLWCAECQGSLGRGRRRWFICEAGRHECYWQGHQMC